MTRRAIGLWMAGAGLLAGCGPSSTGTAWFPLDSGRSWTYEVVSEWENGTRQVETLTLDNEGRDRQLESGAAWRRRSDAGAEYWLRADDSGIYRVAVRYELQAEPTPDAQPRYVLKAPMVAGTQWSSTTTAYLLRRRTEFPPEIRHSHPSVPMTYTIEATDAAVKTAAGSFKGCVRVKGMGAVKLFADPVVGFQNMPLTTTEWYCSGVGLVRLERQEPANSTHLYGGQLVMDLQSWR